MKKLFIVANWKSNKTKSQADEWLAQISNFKFQISNEKEIIICPSFTLLSDLNSSLITHHSLFKLGAQDISPFEEGAYTGEVNGKQIKDVADYVIVGHSERRSHFFENTEMIEKKILIAKQFSLTPILCIQDDKTPIPQGSKIVAYEPVNAIGTGNPDSPENAENIAKTVKEKTPVQYVLYGGSVTSQNVHSFTSQPHIDGVLVGGASLDPQEFSAIIQNA